MDMDLIINAASDALLNVVLAVIALAGAYGVYFIRLGAAKLKEQTAQIKDEAGRKVLEDALDDVVNLATVSVGAMEQTTAKALRDAVKSGKAKPEELAALGKQVFDEVKAAISPQAQKVITDNLGSFDKYLTAMDITADQFKEDNKKQAADVVRQDLALDAWARHFDMKATEEDVHNEFAQADLDDPELIENEWRKEGRLPMIRESIVRANALRDVIAQAKVTEVEETKEAE